MSFPFVILLAACGLFGGPKGDRADRADKEAKVEKKDEKGEKGDKKDRKKDDGDKEGGVVEARPGPGERTLARIAELPAGEPAFVMLVVLDTVRADHTSLCGYTRPTTPHLERFVKAAKAWTCDAYSPAAWTLPSHASYFTGARTSEHGIHDLGGPLRPEFDTLAERYARKGYQTVFLSANPVFSKEASGFWQGFDQVFAAESLRGPLRDDLDTWLRKAFEQVDADRPLFMVVNLFDAHDPYPEVPGGLDWVKKQDRLSLHPHTADATNLYWQFVTGNMAEADKQPFLEKVLNGYDYGVHVADSNLSMLIRGLRERGWIDRPHRIVVTADHGEHLGEHGLLRHGSAVWQTVIKVPFLWFDTTKEGKIELPNPMSATTAFHLLDAGVLPNPALVVEAASARNPDDFKPSWDSVAVLGGPTEKLMMLDGKPQRFDLAIDPGELAPGEIAEGHPSREVFLDSVERHSKSVAEALERPVDPAVIELLRSVGYMQ